MKAKRYFQGLALGLLASGILTATAVAGDEAPYAEFAVDTYSQYIWRGYAFSRDSIVVQPSMTVGWKGFSANLWGNLDTDPYGDDWDKWNETDLTLAYDWGYADFSFSAGYIYYGLAGADDTQELFISASYDTLLEPTLTVYRDIDDAPGWYIALGIGHSIPLSGDINLELGAQAAYAHSSDYKAMHDGLISAAIPFPVGEYFTITPELAYSFALSSKAKDELKEANFDTIGKDKSNFIYGGISISMAF